MWEASRGQSRVSALAPSTTENTAAMVGACGCLGADSGCFCVGTSLQSYFIKLFLTFINLFIRQFIHKPLLTFYHLPN